MHLLTAFLTTGLHESGGFTAKVFDGQADQALGVRFIILNVETSSCTESFQNLYARGSEIRTC